MLCCAQQSRLRRCRKRLYGPLVNGSPPHATKTRRPG